MDRYLKHAILKDKEVIPVPYNTEEEALYWAEMNDKNAILKRTRVGEYLISTVFLGVDHAFGEEPPLWFETMVFRAAKNAKVDEALLNEGGVSFTAADEYCTRYTTYDQAMHGHTVVVFMVESGEIGGEEEGLKKLKSEKKRK